jgi:chemotaxis protein CheD
MTDPAGLLEVFLGPGDLYFGDRCTRIRTLLGSCVAITLWHPGALIGGMCHFMMPTRLMPTRHGNVMPHGRTLHHEHDLSGRYADEALSILLNEIRAAHTAPHDYEAKMFGGGNQFPGHNGVAVDIATRNIDAGLHLLAQQGLELTSVHLGGTGHRQVALDIWSGAVWVRHCERVEEMAWP